MIEKIIREYLAGALDVPVFLEIPEEKPDTYVSLQKAQGSLVNHVGSSVFYIRSVAPSLFESALLNERVKEAMLENDVHDLVYGARLITEFNATEPEIHEYRYQSTITIYHNQEA